MASFLEYSMANSKVIAAVNDAFVYRNDYRHINGNRNDIEYLISLFRSGKLDEKTCIAIFDKAKMNNNIFDSLILLSHANSNEEYFTSILTLIKTTRDKNLVDSLLNLAQSKLDSTSFNALISNLPKEISTNINTQKIDGVELPEEVKEENHLNLENVTDFNKDGKDYIKMHYNNGTIRIVENSLKASGQEIFKDYQSRYGINSNDGAINATNIFETLINECHEVTLTNIKDMTKEEYNNLKPKEKELFDIIRKKYVGYEIIASPEENIYVISSAGKDEKVVSVEERDGKYVIYDVDEKGYKHNNQDNNSVTNDINDEHEYVDVDNVNTNTEVINFNENEEYKKAQDDPTYVNKKDKVKVLTLKRQYPTSKAGYMDAALLSLIVGMSSASLMALLLKIITR